MVTFLVTLVVSTLVSVIITRIYYKHQFEHKAKSDYMNNHTKENNQFVLMNRDVKMETNPSYAVTYKDTIKMDSDPLYAAIN